MKWCRFQIIKHTGAHAMGAALPWRQRGSRYAVGK